MANDCCGITCCNGKSIFGLIAILLANLFFWVGAGMIWGEIHEQVPEDYHFMGAFNSATWYIILFLFVMTVPFTCTGLVKSGWVSNTRVATFFAAISYTGIGYGFFAQTNTFAVPGGGPLSWVSASIANLNTIRIQWEETNRLCATDACTNESQSFYNGFARPASMAALGLGSYAGVIPAGSTASAGDMEDDLQILLVGVIFLFLSGYILFTVASGTKNGIPFAGPLGSVTWTPAYQSAVFTSLIGFAFGLTATFVLWGTDAAADPTHPFYENVLSSAIAVFLVTFLCLVGVFTEEMQWLEATLFFAGFLTFGAPVRMWQMAALADTEGVAGYMSSNKYGINSIAKDAEIDRYLIGGSLTIIGSVIVVYTACKVLAADAKYLAATGSVTTTSPTLRSLRAVMLGASFIGIWIVVGMLWSQLNDALEQVDATDSDRGNAGHYYIFLWLLTYFGFFINGLDAVFSGGAPAEDGTPSVTAKIPFGALKPFVWVSCGLVSAMFCGYLSIGTHDRQLWFLDGSFGNANEVRSVVGGPNNTFTPVRAVGIDMEDYEVVFTAIIILFITINLVALSAMNFPFTVRESVPSSGLATVSFASGTLSFVLFLIGFIILLALNMAAPTVEKAENISVGVCEGISYNMYLDNTDNCFNGHSTEGERFTINLFNPDPVTNYGQSRYYQIFTVGAVAFTAAWFNFFGIVTGSSIFVKVSMYLFAITLATCGFAMNWQGEDGVGNNGSIYDDELCDEDGEGDCQSFKAGFSFFFLQAFFGIIAGAKVIGDQMFNNKTLNDTPVAYTCCGNGCGPCCPSSSGGSAAEEIEMEETPEESRDAITGI